MFKNTYSKTLFEKRWMIIGWSLVIAAFAVFIVSLFPVMRDTFGETLKNVPDSMKSFMGDAQTYQVLNGYVDIQVIYQMVFLPVIMGIILCTGLIAGKEEQGVLQSLLAQPIKRGRAYIELLLASWSIIAVVSLSIFLFTWIGAIIIDEPISLDNLFLATVATWLVTVAISTFSFMLGAITSKRGFSGMITGLIVFIAYIITSLEPSVKYLKNLNYVSPFKYFNTPSIMQNGIRLSNFAVLITITLVFTVIGYIVFVKRDIYQK